MTVVLFFVLKPEGDIIDPKTQKKLDEIKKEQERIKEKKRKLKEKSKELGKDIKELEDELEEVEKNNPDMSLDEAIEYLKGIV